MKTKCFIYENKHGDFELYVGKEMICWSKSLDALMKTYEMLEVDDGGVCTIIRYKGDE